MNEFEPIARKLWHGDDATIRLIEGFSHRDRIQVEQRLLALYGVSVNLFGSIADMKAELERAKRP